MKGFLFFLFYFKSCFAFNLLKMKNQFFIFSFEEIFPKRSSHCSIKNLTEHQVIMPITNKILAHYFFGNYMLWCFSCITKWFIQFVKEINCVLAFYFLPFKFNTILCPFFSKYFEVVFVLIQWIIFFKMVIFKILNQNQDEKIKHNKRNDHYKSHKVKLSPNTFL